MEKKKQNYSHGSEAKIVAVVPPPPLSEERDILENAPPLLDEQDIPQYVAQAPKLISFVAAAVQLPEQKAFSSEIMAYPPEEKKVLIMPPMSLAYVPIIPQPPDCDSSEEVELEQPFPSEVQKEEKKEAEVKKTQPLAEEIKGLHIGPEFVQVPTPSIPPERDEVQMQVGLDDELAPSVPSELSNAVPPPVPSGLDRDDPPPVLSDLGRDVPPLVSSGLDRDEVPPVSSGLDRDEEEKKGKTPNIKPLTKGLDIIWMDRNAFNPENNANAVTLVGSTQFHLRKLIRVRSPEEALQRLADYQYKIDILIIARSGKELAEKLEVMIPRPTIKIIVFTYNPAEVKAWVPSFPMIYTVVTQVDELMLHIGHLQKLAGESKGEGGLLKEGKEGEELMEECVCPLTREVFIDPVIAADGFTYEKEAILKWFSTSDISPMTGLHVANKALIPNISLKKIVAVLKKRLSEG